MWAVSLSRPEPGQQPRLTVSEAAARGLTRANLRSSGWRSPYRGLHVLGPAVAAEDLAPGDRIRDAAALLPVDGQVGGWAAAYLLGVEVLDGRRPGSGAAPVPLLLPRTTTRAGAAASTGSGPGSLLRTGSRPTASR